MDESVGAGTAYSPSPPATVNHSEPFTPPPAPAPPPPPPPPAPTLLDGPHHALLSWSPPHSMYGGLSSAATMQHCPIGRLFKNGQLWAPSSARHTPPACPCHMPSRLRR